MLWGFPGRSAGKESACNTGDPSWIPGLGRSPEEGIGYPLQYYGLPSDSDGKESTCHAGDLGLIPGLGRSPGEWLSTPIFWPGEFHGLYRPWGRKESDTTE